MIANPSTTTTCALLSGLLLAGCVDSAAPLMTGAQPVFGPEVRLHLYVLGENRATGPEPGIYRWQGGEYRAVNKPGFEIASFTAFPLGGNDLIIQSRSTRPQIKDIEYGIARKISPAVYVVGAVDENDADSATRRKLCAAGGSDSCRVANHDDLLTFVRASAAKPELRGSLAILVDEKP